MWARLRWSSRPGLRAAFRPNGCVLRQAVRAPGKRMTVGLLPPRSTGRVTAKIAGARCPEAVRSSSPTCLPDSQEAVGLRQAHYWAGRSGF